MKINEGNYFYVENPKHHSDLKNKIMVVVGTEQLRKDESRRVKLNHINDDDNIVLPAVSQFEKFIRPIKITIQWLIDLGFTKSEHINNRYNLEPIEIYINPADLNYPIVVYYQGMSVPNIEFVYQLQNLYCSLTGKEKLSL